MSFNDMSFNEVNIELDKCSRKFLFWRRSLYLELFAIGMFALVAFFVRLITDNYVLPILLSGSMILVFVFFCFSLYRMKYWEDKAERYSIEISLYKSD